MASQQQSTIPLLHTAIAALRNDGVIAYPTESVFGLGCDPLSESALRRILSIKGRDAHKGFILIAAELQQLLEYLAPIENEWQQQFDQYWPGPYTFVVPAAQRIANTLVSGFRPSIAVRVSDHPVVRALCTEAKTALVSTSANVSGEAALRDAASVQTRFGASLDAIVEAKVGTLAQPTTIIDVLSGKRLR